MTWVKLHQMFLKESSHCQKIIQLIISLKMYFLKMMDFHLNSGMKRVKLKLIITAISL